MTVCVHIQEVQIKKLLLSGERKGLQLTLPSPDVSQSGLYVCVAENRFEKVEQAAFLNVYPPSPPPPSLPPSLPLSH